MGITNRTNVLTVTNTGVMMNKRISELAIKSDLVYKTWPDSKTLRIDGVTTTISGNAALMSNRPDYDNTDLIEKFVTLLVMEAAEQIYLHASPSDADGLEERAVLRGMGIAIDIIKDHYGIRR